MNNLYGPKVRDYLEERPKKVRAYSSKDYTELPDHVTDAIVANNISNVEFDYINDELSDDDLSD